MKTLFIRRLVTLSLTTVIASSPAWATCGGGGGGGDGGSSGKTYTVPWRNASPSDAPIKDGVVLYWFPASELEVSGSPLKNSRALSLYATECVILNIADPSSDLGKKYITTDKLPLVVLAGPDGTAISRVDSSAGPLRVEQVEALVGSEMQKRSADLEAKIDAARTKIKDGDKDSAITDLKVVYDQRCMFPKIGKEAVKELKKLGVSDLAAIPEAPILEKTASAKIHDLMQTGLQAEDEEKFTQAERLYTEASHLDPADPVPLRYLGELYRHQIGDWNKATEVFNRILAMKCDPLSRAVALHGIGKMTIHNGQFKKGKELMEKSLSVYPLAMTCRNLAVYWNSEGDRDKATEYTKQAVKLDPQDRFNLVFGAALFAGNGHPEEALKIAKENEDLLPASYNLAAIYAQNGQKEKALELLKRHFYQYERYKEVRSKEMMEARVDAVFASIVKDPAFLALTSDADNKLPLPGMSKNKAATP